MVLNIQSLIGLEGKLLKILPVDFLLEQIPAEAGKAQVGLASEHHIESSAEAFGVKGGQRPAGDEQTLWQVFPGLVADPKSIVTQRDHGVDSHHVWLVSLERVLDLSVSLEGGVEGPGLYSRPAKLGNQAGRPKRQEERLGRDSSPEVRKNQRDL